MANMLKTHERNKLSLSEKQMLALNKIYKKKKYSIENTKISSKNKRGKKTNELCIEQELILRYYSDSLKDGKIWFLSSMDSILNKKI